MEMVATGFEKFDENDFQIFAGVVSEEPLIKYIECGTGCIVVILDSDNLQVHYYGQPVDELTNMYYREGEDVLMVGGLITDYRTLSMLIDNGKLKAF